MKLKLKLNFRGKMIASTVLIVAISLIVSSYITFTYVTKIVRDQAVRDNGTKLAQTSSSITRMKDRLARAADTVIVSQEINRQIVHREGDSLQDSYYKKVAVQQQLQRFAALDSSLLNIMIIRPDREVFSNYSGYESYYDNYLREEWIQPFLAGRSQSRFSAPHEFSYINGKQQVISYIMAYKNWEDPSADTPYILVFDLKLSELEKVFEDIREDFKRVVLTNKEGIILYDSDNGASGEITPTAEEHSEVIPLEYAAADGDWKLEATLSKSRLYEKIRPILLFYLLIVLASLLFALAVIPPVSAKFTRPISQLARAMRRVSAGELNARVSFRTGDEMEELGAGFNQMVKDLDLWMKSSLHEQEMKRKVQMNLLLSEINPHFIYNTLNTVIYLSHAGRTQDTIVITKAFIDILQDAIATGEEAYFCTLQEEIDLVSKYALIQQYRYPGRFRLEWDIPEELRSCTVLRMMIQPLVENALFHGIDEDGIIEISAAASERGELFIRVKDNGIGMDPAVWYEIRNRQKAAGPKKKGIGLSNIAERIVYHFGEGYGMEIDSKAGSGTAVAIRLPYMPEQAATSVKTTG